MRINEVFRATRVELDLGRESKSRGPGYETLFEAARLLNGAAAQGIAASTPDALIAAQAARLRANLVTIDLLSRLTPLAIFR